MHARLFWLLFLVLVVSPVTAQDDRMSEVVKNEVKKMADASASGNYEVVVALTHPKLIEKLGGEEKAGMVIQEAMEAIKAQGFTFEVQQIDKPSVVRGKESYFSVTSYTLVVTGSGKKVTLKTALVGVSEDKGKTWKFVDTGSDNDIEQILPDLPRELKIPKQKQTIEDVPCSVPRI